MQLYVQNVIKNIKMVTAYMLTFIKTVEKKSYLCAIIVHLASREDNIL